MAKVSKPDGPMSANGMRFAELRDHKERTPVLAEFDRHGLRGDNPRPPVALPSSPFVRRNVPSRLNTKKPSPFDYFS